MFIVTESDAAAIRATFERDGELSAGIELWRRFTDNAKAREWVQTIVGWKPLPVVRSRRLGGVARSDKARGNSDQAWAAFCSGSRYPLYPHAGLPLYWSMANHDELRVALGS
jgi:hypothetical protein